MFFSKFKIKTKLFSFFIEQDKYIQLCLCRVNHQMIPAKSSSPPSCASIYTKKESMIFNRIQRGK